MNPRLLKPKNGRAKVPFENTKIGRRDVVVFVPVFVTDEVEEEVELRLTVTEVPEPDEFDAKGRLPKNSKIKNIYQIRTDP